jgi:hypothetical protein
MSSAAHNEAWVCTNCAKENRSDRNHCWHCSAVKGAVPATSAAAKNTGTSVEKPSICSECSAPLDDDARFCPSCSAPVLLYRTINCPQCGKSLAAGTKFCKYCAAEVVRKPKSIEPVQLDSLEAQRNKAERLAIGGGGVAGVSVLLLLWGYFYTSNLSNVARAGLMNLAGQTDSTYVLAQWSISLGAIGLIVGIVLFIVGMAQR